METSVKSVEQENSLTRHMWVQWLMGEDAQTLLWQVCTWIDDPTVSRGDLATRITGWQRNAQKAIGAQAGLVPIDACLGVYLDQRLRY